MIPLYHDVLPAISATPRDIPFHVFRDVRKWTKDELLLIQVYYDNFPEILIYLMHQNNVTQEMLLAEFERFKAEDDQNVRKFGEEVLKTTNPRTLQNYI